MPPFSSIHERKPTEGGARKMNSIGSRPAGSGSPVKMRPMASGNSTSQKPSPPAKQNQAISPWPSWTPAKGGRTLPTAGMNQAGVTCPGSNRSRIQRRMTTMASARLPATPASQTGSATAGQCGTRPVATSIVAIGMAVRKLARAGCRASSRTAAQRVQALAA
jgi:hypothetical protein